MQETNGAHTILYTIYSDKRFTCGNTAKAAGSATCKDAYTRESSTNPEAVADFGIKPTL